MNTPKEPVSTKELEEISSKIRLVIGSNRDNFEDNVELVIYLLNKIGFSPADIIVTDKPYSGLSLREVIETRRASFGIQASDSSGTIFIGHVDLGGK